jgi:hypothetical protein
MNEITRLIEEEVERRVAERVAEEVNRQLTTRMNSILEKISQTYDISMRQLLRDLAAIEPSPAGRTCCLGVTAKKSRCTRPGNNDGYCKIHLKQKPVTRVPPVMVAEPVTTVVEHTHTLPPLFLRGCPACERNTSSLSRLCI